MVRNRTPNAAPRLLSHEAVADTLGLSGSISIIRQLLAAGLLDELQLLVHPIAVRNGMRLFDESSIPLRLLKSETVSTGVLNLVYGPDTAPPSGDTRMRWRRSESRAHSGSRTQSAPPLYAVMMLTHDPCVDTLNAWTAATRTG